MGLETFALINDKGQVVNHILVDKESADFETTMAGQLEHWGCIRYVETTEDQPIIILDESPEIWTTHCNTEGCENEGQFILPNQFTPVDPFAPMTKKKSELPSDSLLLEENASNRPEGWAFPSHLTIIEG